MSTTSKSPIRRRCSARSFSSMVSSSLACGVLVCALCLALGHQAEAQKIPYLALAPPYLGGVEQVLADHRAAEFARREREERHADERQQQVLHVGRPQQAAAHPFTQKGAGAAEDARDHVVDQELLRGVAGKVVCLEQRA